MVLTQCPAPRVASFSQGAGLGSLPPPGRPEEPPLRPSPGVLFECAVCVCVSVCECVCVLVCVCVGVSCVFVFCWFVVRVCASCFVRLLCVSVARRLYVFLLLGFLYVGLLAF